MNPTKSTLSMGLDRAQSAEMKNQETAEGIRVTGLRRRFSWGLWFALCVLLVGACLIAPAAAGLMEETSAVPRSHRLSASGAPVRLAEDRAKRYHWLFKDRPAKEAQPETGTAAFLEKLDRDIKHARKLYLSGETDNAILQYRSAIDHLESLVEDLPQGHPLLKELEQRFQVFDELATKILGPINTELKEDAGKRIFHLMEKRRLCRLSITLKKAGNLEFFDVPSSLLEDESDILSRLLELRGQVATAAGRQIEEDLKSKLAEVRKSLHKSSRRYTALRKGQPVQLDDFRREVLKPNEIILDFNLLPDRMVVGFITSEKAVYYQVPANRSEIDSAVFVLQDRLKEFAAGDSSSFMGHAWKEPCRRVYRSLLGKLPPLPRDKTSVLVIPDRSLWYLPFAVLLDSEDRPLGQNRSMSIVPSADSLRFIRTLNRESAKTDAASNLILFESIPWIPEEDARETQGEHPKKKAAQNVTEGEKVERLILNNPVYPRPSEMVVSIQKLFKKSEVRVGPTATLDRFRDYKDRGEDVAVLAVPLSMTDNVGGQRQPCFYFSPDKKGRRVFEARSFFGSSIAARMAIVPIAWFDVTDRESPVGEGPLLQSTAIFYSGVPAWLVNYSDPNWGSDEPFLPAVLKKLAQGLPPGPAVSSYPRELPSGLDSSFSGKPPTWAGWILIGDPGM